MTLDLDKKWKSLMPTLKSSGAIYTKKDDPNDEGPDTDPYNVLMRELAFEVKKGTAQERLKTDEEVIAEEKERLEKLEDERIKRMKGEFDADIDGSDDDGEQQDEEEMGEDETGSEEEEGEEEKESDDDAYSDLEDELEESEEESDKKDTKKNKRKEKQRKIIVKVDRIKEMEEAQKQIPFTFKVPESYEELSDHFVNRSPDEKAIILERIVKCNHPQFGDDNKNKLESLFTFVLQHLHDSASEDDQVELEEGLQTIHKLSPFLFDLAKFFPAPAAKAILSVVQEKYEDYLKNSKVYPTLETVYHKLFTEKVHS